MKDTERLLMLYIESNDEGYTPCSTLAQYLHVSERSIKRYIKGINESKETYGAYIEAIKGLGYKLVVTEPALFKEYLEQGKLKKHDDTKITLQLIRYILTNDRVKLDELVDKLYVSRSTLTNALNRVKEWLGEYQIEVFYKPHYGIGISGEEENIRKCIVKYFFISEEGQQIRLGALLGNLTDDKVNTIKDLLEKVILENGINKNQYEIVYLVKFIAVSCYRIQEGYRMQNPIKAGEVEKITHMGEYALKERLQEITHVTIPEEEISYLSVFAQIDEMFGQNKKPSYEYIKTIVTDTLKTIDDKYKVHLQDDEALLRSLSTHVTNAYGRYYFGLEVENITLNQIKKSYPEAFNFALELKENIETNFKVTINQKELGYIAVHFATAIEKAKQNIRYTAYIVCDTGFGTTELLKTKLRRYFSEIEVVGACQVHAVPHLDLEDIDFILSTVKLDKDSLKGTDIVYISHILHEGDIKNIEYELNNLYLENYLKALFAEEIFYPTKKYNTKQEVLEALTIDMYEKGFITLEDREEVFKREMVASTEISDLVAVPHCICMGDTNAIGICTLKKPVLWGSTRVKLVLVACLNIDVVQNKHVFPFIHSRIQKASVVNALCECKNLQEWLHILMGSANE